jgi:hypothetical protein
MTTRQKSLIMALTALFTAGRAAIDIEGDLHEENQHVSPTESR